MYILLPQCLEFTNNIFKTLAHKSVTRRTFSHISNEQALMKLTSEIVIVITCLHYKYQCCVKTVVIGTANLPPLPQKLGTIYINYLPSPVDAILTEDDDCEWHKNVVVFPQT